MPELPEVESTVRRLRPEIIGQKISDCQLSWARTVVTHTAGELRKLLKGAYIQEISRRGKYIIIALSTKDFLLVHLRMSGHLEIRSEISLREPHDRLIISFESKSILAFNDPRKFGKIHLLKDPQEILFKLGPEPTDTIVTAEFLYQRLRKKKTKIKALLLDQSWMAGLGNIYADEVLWRSRIHPAKQALRLTKNHAALLASNARNVITDAIQFGGTDFGDGVVPGGAFVPEAYGREGEPCSRCRTEIKRITIAQRSSYFCSRCQR